MKLAMCLLVGGVLRLRVPVGNAPARARTAGSASGGDAPARGQTPAVGSHYFSKCIPCQLSWGGLDIHAARCLKCKLPLTMFVGKEIRPPSRTRTTPPPPPAQRDEAGGNPEPARGGVAPARGMGLPTPPPVPVASEPARGGFVPARGMGLPTPPLAPVAKGGAGKGGQQMSPLDRALSGPRRETPVRSQDGSRQRPRSEQGHVGGPAATKARTTPNVILTPYQANSVLLTPSIAATVRREIAGHDDETLESIMRLSRNKSVHCGRCRRLSPIGSFKCGFCDLQFLTAREPTRRAPDIVHRGLDRNMQRVPTRNAQARGHTRSVSGDERKRNLKLHRHMHRWDTDREYRLQRSRLGMVRTQYNTIVVSPWMAINASDTPPVLPDPPMGIPTVIA